MEEFVDFKNIPIYGLFSECPLYRIRKKKRMSFLQRQLKKGAWIPKFDKDYYRREFNKVKADLIDLKLVKECYVCRKKPEHRHHVIPLCRGGANTINNIVPLCLDCHSKLEIVYPTKKEIIKILPVINPWRVKNFKSPLSKIEKIIVIPPQNLAM